jgi:hypothetical protein
MREGVMELSSSIHIGTRWGWIDTTSGAAAIAAGFADVGTGSTKT